MLQIYNNFNNKLNVVSYIVMSIKTRKILVLPSISFCLYQFYPLLVTTPLKPFTTKYCNALFQSLNAHLFAKPIDFTSTINKRQSHIQNKTPLTLKFCKGIHRLYCMVAWNKFEYYVFVSNKA